MKIKVENEKVKNEKILRLSRIILRLERKNVKREFLNSKSRIIPRIILITGNILPLSVKQLITNKQSRPD